MAWRPHPRLADTDPTYPRAWATDDRSGFVTNLHKLRWEVQWAGNELIRTGFLVAEPYYDQPQEQFRTIILPADPPPVFNARPEPYVIDETDWLTTGVRGDNPDNNILVTQDGEMIVTQPSATEAETEDTG